MLSKEAIAWFHECNEAGKEAEALRILDSLSVKDILDNGLCGSAIEHDRLTVLKFALEKVGPQLHVPFSAESHYSRGHQLLEFAIPTGHFEAVKMLVAFGCDINGRRPDGFALACESAPRSNNLELLRWLLDKGATVNKVVNNCECSYLLLSAAHKGYLDMVKLLVERGALVNGTNFWGLTALSYAQMGGSQEVVDYLRSVGAKYPWEILGLPPPPPREPAPEMTEQNEAFDYHFCAQLGSRWNPIAHDFLRPDWPITIHLLSSHNCWILATEGMSAHPMTIPDSEGANQYQYAELFLRLPDTWPVNKEWLQLPENQWMLDWIYRIARWPDENKSWLGPAAIFANGEPPQPLAPGMPFTCLLAMTNEEDVCRLWLTEEKLVRYYWLYPIYTEERDFERSHNTQALIQRFLDSQSPLHVDPSRKNVCK